MNSEAASRHMDSIARHYRQSFQHEILRRIWNELLSEPEEALSTVAGRLRRGPRYGMPTPEVVLSMTKAEARQQQQQSVKQERSSESRGLGCLQLMLQLTEGKISRDEYEAQAEQILSCQ
jgi:hypothetical protein